MPSTQHVDNEFSNRFFADVFQLDPQVILIWAAGINQAFVINTTSTGVLAPVTWGFALDNLTLTSTVVPEPSTALMGVVALGFAIGRRRRA